MGRRRVTPLFIAGLVAIAVYAAMELGWRRPEQSITDDWQGWRQADTMAMAQNLAFVEPNPLRPRIDWGGDGPGYVEAEMALYPAFVAVGMRAGIDGELAGQLVSLAFTALALWILFRGLAARFGELPALVGLFAALGTRGVVVIGTSIQPDTLSFLCFTLGFFAFLRYLETPTWPRLAAWVVPTLIAGLVKPTALEIGIAQGILVLARRRDLLLRAQLWLGWAAVLAGVGAYLLYSRGLYLEYGNTFGVLSGGDSKLPSMDRILDLGTWRMLLRYAVVWGVGYPAIAAALYLIVRRRLDAESLALAAAAAAVCLVAFRYTSGTFGTHYHLPHVVLGGWLVARATAEISTLPRGRLMAWALAGAMALAAIAQTVLHLRVLAALTVERETVLGRDLATLAAPGTLVAVRSPTVAFEPEWQTVNNFEDPRVLYLSRTRGWVLARDDRGPASLAQAAQRGARYYVQPSTFTADPELAAWLSQHAQPVVVRPEGIIYRL